LNTLDALLFILITALGNIDVNTEGAPPSPPTD
jgi:hypothetical protein